MCMSILSYFKASNNQKTFRMFKIEKIFRKSYCWDALLAMCGKEKFQRISPPEIGALVAVIAIDQVCIQQ